MGNNMKIQNWKFAHVKRVGTSHIQKNVPCQDDTHMQFENGVIVLALADGAGSRKFSHVGSRIVVNEISKLIVNNFDRFYIQLEQPQIDPDQLLDIKKEMINYLHKCLYDYVVNNPGVLFEDLASTLLFYAYSKNRYIMGHLGDGIIGTYKQSQNTDIIETSSFPENGEAANITFFTTNQDVLDHLRISAGTNYQLNGIVLMSDGPEEAFFDPFNGLNQNTVKLFSNFSKLSSEKYKTVLEQLLGETISKISDDDLSLNIAYLDTKEIDSSTFNRLKNELSQLNESQCLFQVSRYTYRFDETFLIKQSNFNKIVLIKEMIQS
jgi:hypothetical protein